MADIFVLEDEPNICEGLISLLSREGHRVRSASDCQEAIKLLQDRQKDDLFLLDVSLPDGDGFEICRKLRRITDRPILFLTAADDEKSVIKGLELGGDDYITKPFRAKELLSRIHANLRRTLPPPAPNSAILCSGDLKIDTEAGRLWKEEKELSLRKTEWDLLLLFVENPGVLLTRRLLIDRLWDRFENYVEDNTLSVQMSRLRKQIGTWQETPYISTSRGIGYRWEVPVHRYARRF